MAMPAVTARTDWTVEEVNALPDDGNRYEVLDGELFVSPAPSLTHQRVLRELVRLLLPYVDRLDMELIFAPAAVTWGPRTELQPDIFVLPKLPGRTAVRFEDVGVLTLAIEVISPSSARADRFKKRPEYQRRGVAEYWIADPDARLVERWRPHDDKPEVVFQMLAWRPREDVSALEIDLVELYRRVYGE